MVATAHVDIRKNRSPIKYFLNWKIYATIPCVFVRVAVDKFYSPTFDAGSFFPTKFFTTNLKKLRRQEKKKKKSKNIKRIDFN